MILKEDSTEKKLRGAYYTPLKLADKMVEIFKQDESIHDILEPSCGDVGFIVACVHLLSETGKIAFVIPAEILQVAYVEDLRLFFADKLSKITLITFEKLVFPDIEQEIIVFIGERGGVLEILPGEAGNIVIPVLDTVPMAKIRKILEKVDEVIREDQDIEVALDLVDQEILVECLQIEAENCVASRQIWRKMQRRRLKRG